jgi:hypothetical protein
LRIFRTRFSFWHLSSNSLESLPIFGNNFFETTFLWRTDELARAHLPTLLGDRKSAGKLTRAPNKLSLPVVLVVSNLNILTFKHSKFQSASSDRRRIVPVAPWPGEPS